MTRRVRSAFGRWLALGCASAVMLVVGASSVAAQQTTGKIEGTVTDPQGGPIATAQITVVGTALNAVTDDKGYYFLNNVPVAIYTLRAKFIGYSAQELTGVRVLGGNTITENFKLTPSAVAVTGVTVEAAANPIVPRDQVTSKSTIHDVAKLPVDDVRNVIALQPGVVESNSGQGLVLRGGRPGEANVYIDGAPVRSTAFGSQIMQVGRNAVEEASVTTGAIGVQLGDAQSGIIAYTTKSGGAKLAGSGFYESDEPFGNAISVGYNRFEGSLNGPIPSVPNLHWFASGALQGQSSPFTGLGWDTVPNYVLGGLDTTVNIMGKGGSVTAVPIPKFVQYGGACPTGSDATNAARNAILQNYGQSCQGRRQPLAWSTVGQMQGKLDYSYGSGSNVALTGLASWNQTRDWPGSIIGDPTGQTGTHTWSRLGVLNLNHNAFRSADHALALNVNLSYAQDRQIHAPLDASWEASNRDPMGGINLGTMQFLGLQGMPFPISDQVIQAVRTNSGVRTPYLNRTDLNFSQPYRMNPYGELSGAWYTAGLNSPTTLYSENRYRAYAQADWQVNRFHRFNLGGEFKKSDVAYWRSSLVTQIFMNAYLEHPQTAGLWAADRLDLGDVVIELGVRWDYFDSKALFPTTPASIFSNPAAQKYLPAAGTDPAVYAQFLADRAIWTPAQSHKTLSPRLGVSFPITEKTGFRLSYAHQVQTPEFNQLLSGSNNDLTVTNTNDTFGRDATFGKTILFEFGVRHAFTQDLVLDVSAYNKDFSGDLAYRIQPFPDPRNPGTVVNANVLTNGDFGYARGLDFKLDWRRGTWFNGSVAYTFQIARSTGSDPTSYLRTAARQTVAVTGDRLPPPEQPLPTDDNREHNVVGAIALTVPRDWQPNTTLGMVLRDVGLTATFRAVSGLPYTLLINSGGGSLAPREAFGISANSAESQNASTMPSQKFLDVRVNKGVHIGRMDWTVFVDARNVLNFRNVVQLFSETGDVVNPNFLGHFLSPEFNDLKNEASSNGALRSPVSLVIGGNTIGTGSVDLSSCATWSNPVNCVMLQRTEARFGDGTHPLLLTPDDQLRAFTAGYNLFNGVQTMYGQPRHIRIGAELNF